MITSTAIPPQTLKLVEMMKKQIANGEFQIFSGDLYDQEHVLKNQGSNVMSPTTLMKMDWLVDNVVGGFPKMEEIHEDFLSLVDVQGFGNLGLNLECITGNK